MRPLSFKKKGEEGGRRGGEREREKLKDVKIQTSAIHRLRLQERKELMVS